MTWFKVDDKFHDHPKARRAGLAACGLWLRAGSWAADQLTDGFVPDDVLPRWGGRGVDVFALADLLVEVGLWERRDDDLDPGYVFRKWAKYQPTRAKVLADREAARERMAAVRANKGPSSEERSHEQGANVRVTPSRPVPTRPGPVVDAREVAPLHPVDNTGLTDDDLDKIARQTNGDRAYARRIAADVLDRAGQHVHKPLAYVLRAIAEDPARYRRTARVTAATECPRHPGQSATACGPCRTDHLDPAPSRGTQVGTRGPR